jgi:hypothetical protein
MHIKNFGSKKGSLTSSRSGFGQRGNQGGGQASQILDNITTNVETMFGMPLSDISTALSGAKEFLFISEDEFNQGELGFPENSVFHGIVELIEQMTAVTRYVESAPNNTKLSGRKALKLAGAVTKLSKKYKKAQSARKTFIKDIYDGKVLFDHKGNSIEKPTVLDVGLSTFLLSENHIGDFSYVDRLNEKLSSLPDMAKEMIEMLLI